MLNRIYASTATIKSRSNVPTRRAHHSSCVCQLFIGISMKKLDKKLIKIPDANKKLVRAKPRFTKKKPIKGK